VYTDNPQNLTKYTFMKFNSTLAM